MRRRRSPVILAPAPVADAQALERLSAREREVLALAAGGYLDKQIAASLGITANTLRTYWTRIRSKLGEASRGALVALYVTVEAAVANALKPIDGANWHIDVARNVLVFYGDRGLFPKGEIDLDAAIDRYVPEDREKVRALIRACVERDMPPFTFAARLDTARGVETASAYVECVREGGRTVRIVGRHVPLLILSASEPRVGTFRRDLRTGEVTFDEGFRRIYRLAPDEPDPVAAIFARICPEFREPSRGIVAGMLAAGERCRLVTVRLCPNDGTDGWVTFHVRIEHEGGQPAFATATALAYH